MIEGKKIVKALLKGDVIYGDVFVEKKVYTHIHRESSKFERIEEAEDKGSALRVITPWKQYMLSTNSTDEKELLDLAREIPKLVFGEKDKVIVKVPEYPFKIEKYPDAVNLSKKMEIVEWVEKTARSMDPRIKQVRVIYKDTKQKVSIHTSFNETIFDERYQILLNLLLVGEKDGEIQTSYESIGGFYGFEYLTQERLFQFVEKTVTRLKKLFEAKEAPSGIKVCVLASEAGGTMIHEAVGHGLEADLALEGLSCYKGLLGEKVASPLITIVDDKTLSNMRGTYAYDDEGTPAERTVLIENGILKNYLFDKFYAMKHGRQSTGNGRRESYRYKPIPRMSNTFILPGNTPPEDIIASVDDGIYVLKMGGGQVDTVTGDFVFEVSEGYFIERGQIGDMIKNATIMGNGPKVLKEIDMVGSDLGFGIGTCGKDGQGVPVSDGQPTLRIPEMIVGGKSVSKNLLP
ncbi:MAG: TldD/PmbA family protein [Desulfobacterota bacterium]|nr:TldD/PmbA family protein [Thermodesulfobacteriota bacterium]